jgi:branched-chain amino acid aminotransferase
MTDRKIWFKGLMIPADQARVSVLSPMAQYGVNVFEGIRCYSSSNSDNQLFVFRLEEHLARLLRSAKIFGIACPFAVDDLRKHLIESIVANDYHQDTIVRLTLFVDGEGGWSATEPVEMFIAPIQKKRTNTIAPTLLRACVSTWRRIDDNSTPPRVKAGANYINGRYAHLEAVRQGCDVPLLLGYDGKLAEGAGACIFLVRDGTLITPPPTSSSLESITRSSLLELARDAGMQVVERVVDRTELYLADEIFLCGTAAEVAPICSVDNMVVGSGKLGPITLSVLKNYHDVVSGAEPRFASWLTPVY